MDRAGCPEPGPWREVLVPILEALQFVRAEFDLRLDGVRLYCIGPGHPRSMCRGPLWGRGYPRVRRDPAVAS